MDIAHATLTVCFVAPFWRGIFERTTDGALSVCQVTFGAEPKDQEIRELISTEYFKLEFCPPTAHELRQKADNPKRRQREAAKAIRASGPGTKSQQLLQAQREEATSTRTKLMRRRRDAESQHKYAMRCKKHKEKHKGH